MTIKDRYLRLLLHLARWWSVGLGGVSAIILACVLVDWVGEVGWGYPWYAGIIGLALVGLAIGLWKLTTAGLERVGR